VCTERGAEIAELWKRRDEIRPDDPLRLDVAAAVALSWRDS
jgi:hypothetical protein